MPKQKTTVIVTSLLGFTIAGFANLIHKLPFTHSTLLYVSSF